MSVSNIKLSPSTTSVKAGGNISFFITWTGEPEYQQYVGDRISVSGAGAFAGLVNIKDAYFSGKSFSFNFKVPNNWAGAKSGWFNLAWTDSTTSLNIVADTGVTPNCAMQVTGKMNPVISLNPANPTIKPGESSVFSVNVSGIEAPFTITEYKWRYMTSPIGGNTPTLTIPWSHVGYEFVKCEVTIQKDGYDTATVGGDTKITMVQGTMDGVRVMIGGLPPEVKIFERINGNATVTGAPERSTIAYEWKVNGISSGKTDKLDVNAPFSAYITGPQADAEIQVIVSVYAPDYTGITVESPIIKIPVKRYTVDEAIPQMLTLPNETAWGAGCEIELYPWSRFSTIYQTTGLIEGPVSLTVDDKPVESTIQAQMYVRGVIPNVGPGYLGKHTVKFTGKFKETYYNEPGDFNLTTEFTTKGYNPSTKDSLFYIGDKDVSTEYYYMKESPGAEIKLQVKNVFDPKLRDAAFRAANPEYVDQLENLAKQGTYDLLDFKDNVVATAVNGLLTVKLPDELKTIKGTLRHTFQPNETFPNGYTGFQLMTFELVANPMVPMPVLTLTQTPSPVTIGKYARIERTITNLPEGTDINDSRWFVNQSAFGNSSDISVQGEFNKSIRNNTFAVPTGFDPAVLTADLDLLVELKKWPAITLDLIPARTTVPWGEFLISGYDVVGEEVMDDQNKLVISPPVWYLDGSQLQTVAGDGSLMVRATHPGNHVIKASVHLRHPDYENGEKVVEQSFNMTTEKREMATTLTLLPVDAVVGIGKSQKFTATLTGAPADATTTYVWTVDDVVQSSTANNMDYTATTEGVKAIKVVATTKAQDAEDDIKEATVNLTVNKNVMVLTVIGSTTTPNIKIDDSWSMKCDVTGQPAGATIAYKWDTGETTQTISGTAASIGTITNKCTVTVKATDYDDAVQASNVVSVVVKKKDQTTTATATTTTADIQQLQNYNATANVSGAPAGATITYLWSNGETTKTFTKKAEKSGIVKVKCTVTVKATDYEDKVIETNEVTINVSRVVVPGVQVEINSTPADVKVGEEYTVTCVVTGYPVGSDVAFTWDTGETTSSIKRTQTTEGDYTHSCVVKVTHADFNTSSTTKEITVHVEDDTPVVPDECPLLYVHPLPWRASAYIWCGWWVMDAIQSMTEAGKNWKQATKVDTPYYCHLNVLAKMLVDFPEVDVQESRHGYIVHRSALDLGIIY